MGQLHLLYLRYLRGSRNGTYVFERAPWVPCVGRYEPLANSTEKKFLFLYSTFSTLIPLILYYFFTLKKIKRVETEGCYGNLGKLGRSAPKSASKQAHLEKMSFGFGLGAALPPPKRPFGNKIASFR